MKKRYIIIVSLLIILLISITLYEMLSEDGRERRALREAEKEYREYMDKMYEERLVVYGQFDEVVTYCKKHEESFMKVSEMFLEEFYADITPPEIDEIAQNQTLPEWAEVSKNFSLNYGNFIDADQGIYYHYTGGGGSSLGVLYIDADHMDADEIDCHTNPSRDDFLSKIYKVNDYLYVCIYDNPMVGI